jgi:hypothetical protein
MTISRAYEFSNYPTLPGRVSAEKAAELLGFAPHDIPVLIRRGLLKPLGHPAPNAPKFFAGCDILELKADRGWLDRASKAVAENWRQKNKRRALRDVGPKAS